MARFIVAGGGIGGLSAALAVAAAGHSVVVAERNDTFAELGAGIQLAPNALDALDRLGMGAAAQEIGVHIDGLRFMDGMSGAHVMTMPLTGDYVRRFGRPYLVVHRGELHRLLVQACRDCEHVTLRSGVEITGYGQRGGDVRVDCRGGDKITGDALIGADGIRSAVRAQLVGDGEPRVIGITVYRSMIPMTEVPPELRSNTVTWWTGPGCHFVHYPIAGGEYLNLAPSSETGVTSAFSGVPVQADEVLGELAALGGTARRLLELGRDWRAWALVDREPVDRWCEERVALLGDAAHPMLHYVAQGACQALEDAVVLGDRLAANPGDIARAFAEYATARRERTAAMQQISLDSIRLWHARGTRARARNAGLASLSAQDMFDEVAWMHGYRCPAPRLAGSMAS